MPPEGPGTLWGQPIAEWDFKLADDRLAATVTFDGRSWNIVIEHAAHGQLDAWPALYVAAPLGQAARVIERTTFRTLETAMAIARRFVHAFGRGRIVLSTWDCAGQTYRPLITEQRKPH
ncbi:MAG: hypothetical protein DCC73_11545 [Proteobacteria bacterium]|nr:MAG: hypothetical protein DCC73_11545 [Pseudomonadota bacterium]